MILHMKILFITAAYLPTINGVSIHIRDLKKTLEKLGHKVFILAPSFPGYQDIEKNIIRYPSLPNPFAQNYPLGIPITGIEKIKKIKPDIIHTHHPLIIGKFASYVSQKINTPLFFTAHTRYDQYLNYYFPHGYQITSRVITNDLKNLSQKCKKVICPSPETEKRLNKLGIKNTKVIFNGVDTKTFTPGEIKTKTPILIFTGRLEKEKNPIYLVKLAKKLKEKEFSFKMQIIGDGRLLPEISRLVFKYKLEENIILGGKINQEILPSIYQSADIFFTPSKSEVMPLSLLEALACGLPVVCLEKSNLESLITNGKNGLVLKDNLDLVAESIIRLLDNRKVLKNMSIEARKTALKYSLEQNAKEILKTYTEK